MNELNNSSSLEVQHQASLHVRLVKTRLYSSRSCSIPLEFPMPMSNQFIRSRTLWEILTKLRIWGTRKRVAIFRYRLIALLTTFSTLNRLYCASRLRRKDLLHTFPLPKRSSKTIWASKSLSMHRRSPCKTRAQMRHTPCKSRLRDWLKGSLTIRVRTIWVTCLWSCLLSTRSWTGISQTRSAESEQRVNNRWARQWQVSSHSTPTRSRRHYSTKETIIRWTSNRWLPLRGALISTTQLCSNKWIRLASRLSESRVISAVHLQSTNRARLQVPHQTCSVSTRTCRPSAPLHLSTEPSSVTASSSTSSTSHHRQRKHI